jgi:hypothetical protein
VVAPAVPEYCTLEDVLARLRIPTGHPDAGYVDECRAAAAELVATELGVDLTDPLTWPAPWPSEQIPNAVHRAAIGVTIRIYRFKDVESDVADTWGPTGAVQIPRDPLAGYVDLLAPFVHDWPFG